MSMPVGYSGGSLIPVPDGASSAPIMAMRGGGGGAELTGGAGGSLIHLTGDAARVQIQAMSGGGQVGGDGLNAGSLANMFGPANNNAFPKQKVSVKFANTNTTQTAEGVRGTQPSKASSLTSNVENMGLNKVFGSNNAYPAIDTSATTPPPAPAPSVQEGLPYNIFGNEYHIRPKSERGEDAELTKEEQAVIKLWRADEYYTRLEDQNKFLNELVYGCRSDRRIPTDPECKMVRILLTNLASREWGAFHSDGRVKGLSGIDREKCEFVFEVDGASCDMTKVVNEADLMSFFTKPDEIMDKASYGYLDSAPAVVLAPGTEPCTLTLEDVNDALRMAAIAGFGKAGSNEALKNRIHAHRDRLIHFIATMCDTVKTERESIDAFLFGSGTGVPALFTGAAPDTIAGIRAQIGLLRSDISDSYIRELIPRILRHGMDASGANGGTLAIDLRTGLEGIVNDVSGANQFRVIANRSIGPLTQQDISDIAEFTNELLGEDEFSRIIREVLENPHARALANRFMNNGMHAYRAFREAHNIIFYRLGMPRPPPGGPGGGSGTASPAQINKLRGDAREMIELMRRVRELIGRGVLDAEGNPIAGGTGAAVAGGTGAGAAGAGAGASGASAGAGGVAGAALPGAGGVAGADLTGTAVAPGAGGVAAPGGAPGGAPGAGAADALPAPPGGSLSGTSTAANPVGAPGATPVPVLADAGARKPAVAAGARKPAVAAPPAAAAGAPDAAAAGAPDAAAGAPDAAAAGAPDAAAGGAPDGVGSSAGAGDTALPGAAAQPGAAATPTTNISTLSNEQLCAIIASANDADAEKAKKVACDRIREAEEAEAKVKAEAGAGAGAKPDGDGGDGAGGAGGDGGDGDGHEAEAEAKAKADHDALCKDIRIAEDKQSTERNDALAELPPGSTADKELCDDILEAERKERDGAPGDGDDNDDSNNNGNGASGDGDGNGASGASHPAPPPAPVLGEEDIAQRKAHIQSVLTSITSEQKFDKVIHALEKILEDLTYLEETYPVTTNRDLSTYIKDIREKVLAIANNKKQEEQKFKGSLDDAMPGGKTSGILGKETVVFTNKQSSIGAIQAYDALIAKLATPATRRINLMSQASSRRIGYDTQKSRTGRSNRQSGSASGREFADVADTARHIATTSGATTHKGGSRKHAKGSRKTRKLRKSK